MLVRLSPRKCFPFRRGVRFRISRSWPMCASHDCSGSSLLFWRRNSSRLRRFRQSGVGKSAHVVATRKCAARLPKSHTECWIQSTGISSVDRLVSRRSPGNAPRSNEAGSSELARQPQARIQRSSSRFVCVAPSARKRATRISSVPYAVPSYCRIGARDSGKNGEAFMKLPVLVIACSLRLMSAGLAASVAISLLGAAGCCS